MKRYFKVSAEWLKACGEKAEARVFPVISVETNGTGAVGFDAFVDLDVSGAPELAWLASTQKVWTVASARGEFVEAAGSNDVVDAPVKTGDRKPFDGRALAEILRKPAVSREKLNADDRRWAAGNRLWSAA